MGFGRHRQQTQPEIKPAVKVEKKKEPVTEKKTTPVEIVRTKTDPELSVQKDPEPKKEFLPKSYGKKKEEPVQIKKEDLIELETIEKVISKERKQRVDRKESINIGIVGDTIECRDFRAIIKKKGLQINTVLKQMLNDWNMANYNL